MRHRIPIFGHMLTALAVIAGVNVCVAKTGMNPVMSFPAADQDQIQREYAGALKNDIVQTVERITGIDTVAATVRASIDWEVVEEAYREPPYRGIVRRQGLVVNGLDVGVVIDDKRIKTRSGQMLRLERSPTEMKKLTDLIRVIVGYDAERGDRLIVQNYPFQPVRRSVKRMPLIFWGIGGLLVGSALGLGLYFGQRQKKSFQPFVFGDVLHFVRRHPDLAVRILRRWTARKERPNPRQYAPAERAGVILLSLGQTEIRKILGRLSADEVKNLKQIIARLGPVAGRDVRESLNLFYREMAEPSAVSAAAVQPDLPPKKQPTESAPDIWDRFARLDADDMRSYLMGQESETVALILYHLTEEVAAKALALLPREMRARVLIHLMHIRQIRPFIRNRWSARLASDLSQIVRENAGRHKVTAILRAMDRTDSADLVQDVAAVSETAGHRLSTDLKQWADIFGLSPDKIRRLLVYCDKTVVAAALKDESTEAKDVFARELSPELWQSLEKRMAEISAKPEAKEILLKTAKELGLFG